MYREKVYHRNGFRTHKEFVEMVTWLRVELGLSLDSIAKLYGTTKVYIGKITKGEKPGKVTNRKPRGHSPRPETGTGQVRDSQEQVPEVGTG